LRFLAYYYYGRGRRDSRVIQANQHTVAYDIARSKMGRAVIVEDISKRGKPFTQQEDNREWWINLGY
jgi:hypothetical protein